MQVEFGALLESCSLTWPGGQIDPLPTWEEVKYNLSQPFCSHKEWIYPPLIEVGKPGNSPAIPESYSLPATHMLTLEGDDREKANFLISLLGMLKGVRLQRADWLHLYKTPLTRRLNDFVAEKAEIERTLRVASAFWDEHIDENIRKLLFGALHWHLFAQLYPHEFERFNGQYAAFDACSKLAASLQILNYEKQPRRHVDRPEKLCAALQVPLPEWGKVNSDKCALSERRNALVHESIYAGQPIGFALPQEHANMERHLTGLVARIYLRLLGVKNEYTRSSCTTDQLIGFSFSQLNE